MKKNIKKTPLKRYLFGASILLVLVLAYGLAAHSRTWWPFHATSQTDQNASRNEKVANPSPKNNAIPSKTDTSSSTSGETSDQVPVDHSLNASITQLSEANGQVNFKAQVSNASGTGTCVVTFSNPNDRPVTKQFNATYSAGVASCGPISIPAEEFSYLGQWQVSFHFYINSSQASAESSLVIK